MGIGAEDTEPRWSVMRNVLGWGLDEEEKKEEEKIPADENKE